MTDEEIKLFQMALHIAGLEADKATIDLFFKVNEVFQNKGGDMTMKEACEIRADMIKNYGGKTIMHTLNLTEKL